MILENTILTGPFTLVLLNPLKIYCKLWFPAKVASLVKDFNVSAASLIISQHSWGLKESQTKIRKDFPISEMGEGFNGIRSYKQESYFPTRRRSYRHFYWAWG